MICHKHKTVFIHIPKTAGTSVEAMFGFVKIKNQNFFKDEQAEKHWNAEQIKNKYGGYFEEYFKWTVVRNPWDREISLYNMMKRQRKFLGIEFKTFLNKVVIPGKKTREKRIFQDQIDFFTIEDEVSVDQIVRYEYLKSGWRQICSTINKPEEKLEHLRNLSQGSFELQYDQESIEMVADIRKKDINFLNYDMPQI